MSVEKVSEINPPVGTIKPRGGDAHLISADIVNALQIDAFDSLDEHRTYVQQWLSDVEAYCSDWIALVDRDSDDVKSVDALIRYGRKMLQVNSLLR